MKLDIVRLEQGIAILAGCLIVGGIALIYPPAAVIVAGLLLFASVISLPRRSRP